jgi:4-carboxymuconolactone decarboxylase
MNAFTVVVLWVTMAFAFLGGFGSRSALAQQSSAAGQSAEKLPPDIRPDSFNRMPRPKREDFTTEEEKQAFERVLAFEPSIADQNATNAGGSVLGGELGPSGVRAQIPEVAEIYRKLDIMIHQKSGLDPKNIELTVLVALRETNNKVEWQGHEREKNFKLLSPNVVDIVRNNQDTKGLEEKEALIIQFGRELFRQPKVSSKIFAETERVFGRRSTLCITLLMGYYAQNTLLYRAYDFHKDPRNHPSPTW